MWRIVEWSREEARGRIESVQDRTVRAPEMEFDGSVALVDDFESGELVHIELETVNGSHRVSRIWPDDPRFIIPDGHRSSTAARLSKRAAGNAEKFLTGLQMREVYRIASHNDDRLALHGDDGLMYPPPGDEIVAIDLLYMELPAVIEPKYIRLSRPAERDYLCGRLGELDEDAVGLTLIDDDDRSYFLVARGFEYRDPRPG